MTNIVARFNKRDITDKKSWVRCMKNNSSKKRMKILTITKPNSRKDMIMILHLFILYRNSVYNFL